MSLPNYPANPTIGQRFTLPSGVIMECVEVGSTPRWKAYDARLDVDVVYQVESINELRLTAGTFDGQSIIVSSYYASGNTGGGVFVWDAASTAADDGGVTIAVTGVATGRWVRQLEGFVTPEMFGARGDGVADDTAMIQLFFNYLGFSGYAGRASASAVYALNARVITQSPSEPIYFDGQNCEFKRASDFAATLIELEECHGSILKNFSVDCQHQIFPNGNHGLVVANSNDALVENIIVKNHRNTAVLMFATIPSVYKNNIMRNCQAIGNASSPANNGLLIAELDDSGIENCYAENVTGSPGYGLQHKNDCKRGWITKGRAKNCLFAMGWGNDSGVTGVVDGYYELLYADNCEVALDAGRADRNVSVIGKVKGSSVASRNMINLTNCNDNDLKVGVFEDAAAAQVLARFRTGCSGNTVRAGLIKRTLANAAGCAATFDSGVQNNLVIVDNIVGASTSYVGQLTTNNSGNITNTFEYTKLPNSQNISISSGAVTINNSKTTSIAIDTEGAAATDDLSIINGGVEGQVIRIRTVSNLRDVTIKHGIGNILLDGQADFTLTGVADTIMLCYNTSSSQWCEVGRGNNIV